MKIIEKFWKIDVEVLIEFPFTFEAWFKSFINQWLAKGYTHWKLKSKRTKKVVLTWKIMSVWQRLYFKLFTQ
jgi:hypothetical protein